MNEINYYFVRSSTDFDILKSLILKNKINLNSITAVLWEAQWATFFNENDINYVVLEDYTKHINYDRLSKKTIDLIKGFSHKKLLNNKSLVELLEYNGYSLWWFIRQGFFTHCSDAIKEIYTIELLFKNRKIRNVNILNQDEQFIGIVKEATKNFNIKINYIDPKFLTKKRYIFDVLENKKQLLLDYLPRLIRIIQGFFRHLQIKNKPGKRNILLFTRSNVWSTLSGDTKGDTNSYTIMRSMSKSADYNLIQLDVALTSMGAWKGIKEKKKPFIPYDYFIFRSFLDFSVRKKLKFLRLILRSLWKKLDKNEIFKESLVCDGISLYPILRQQIKSYFFGKFGSFISAARNIEIGKKILDDYKIDLTICVDENGAARFLVFASKIKGIPSVGLQHGIITTQWNVSYNYSKDDIYKYKGNLNCQLPDKTAVFGNYFKGILLNEGKYSASKVVVTGQPRFDIVYQNKKNYSKKRFYKRFGIKNREKLIVYASQPSKEGRKITFSAIVEVLKHLKNVKLIVKLHPRDEPDPYNSLLQKLKYQAIISKDIDLYEVFICSDLVIAIHSTVILEALALEKAVIQFSLIGKYDRIFGKRAEELMKLINKEEELSNAIKTSLYDKSYSKGLRKKRKEFISKYFYKIDGKSTERFIGVMKSLLKRS